MATFNRPGRRRNAEPPKRLAFSGIPLPIELIGCGNLDAIMAKFFRAWPFREYDGDPALAPVIRMRRDDNGDYALEAPWLARPLLATGATDALCNLSVDLVNAYFRANRDSHCLHGAAAEFSDRLVVFPNTNKTGKSLLMAGLAKEGVPVYGDDLVAVTSDFQGMSFGIPPRLRQPLPENEPGLASFVHRSIQLQDPRYCYLDGEAARLAPFGSSKPIGAIVVLEREDGAAASLTPGEPSLGLQALVRQQFLREGEALHLLDFSTLLANNIPCWVLSYATVSDAIPVLREAFCGPSTFGYQLTDYAASPFATASESNGAARPKSARMKISGKPYRQSPDVTQSIQADSVFLIGHEGSTIYQTNEIGRIVWELLREPITMHDVALSLAEAFPAEPRERIRNDVKTLFEDLLADGLIAPA